MRTRRWWRRSGGVGEAGGSAGGLGGGDHGVCSRPLRTLRGDGRVFQTRPLGSSANLERLRPVPCSSPGLFSPRHRSLLVYATPRTSDPRLSPRAHRRGEEEGGWANLVRLRPLPCVVAWNVWSGHRSLLATTTPWVSDPRLFVSTCPLEG